MPYYFLPYPLPRRPKVQDLDLAACNEEFHECGEGSTYACISSGISGIIKLQSAKRQPHHQPAPAERADAME